MVTGNGSGTAGEAGTSGCCPILRRDVRQRYGERIMAADELMVVGIGASAGGIQAIKRFFEHVPADSGIAYVVVLHLSPDHDSQLAAVLQTSASIPVTQVHTRAPLEPN